MGLILNFKKINEGRAEKCVCVHVCMWKTERERETNRQRQIEIMNSEQINRENVLCVANS